MTEGSEHALEYALAGIMFCIAFSVLLLLHTAFIRQIRVIGNTPERLILFEREDR